MKKKELEFGRKSIQHIKSEEGFGIKEIAVALAAVVIVGIFLALFRGKASDIFDTIWGYAKGLFENIISSN